MKWLKEVSVGYPHEIKREVKPLRICNFKMDKILMESEQK